MKKVFYSAMMAMMIASCGNNVQQQTNAEEEMESDSTSVAASEGTDEALTDGYKSVDYQTFNLRGDVAALYIYLNDENCEYTHHEMKFDEFGRLNMFKIETFDGPDCIEYVYPDDDSLVGKPASKKVAEEMGIDCEMRRDGKGRLTHFPQNDYAYDSKGRICKESISGWESCNDYTYTEYNENGDPVKGSYEGSGEGEEWSGTVEIEYEEYDEKGNWTKRLVRYIQKVPENSVVMDRYIRTIEYR